MADLSPLTSCDSTLSSCLDISISPLLDTVPSVHKHSQFPCDIFPELQLVWHFWGIIYQPLKLILLRITIEGSIPEMRIWSILLIKSDLKWCIHLSRSLFLYSSTLLYVIALNVISSVLMVIWEEVQNGLKMANTFEYKHWIF